MAWDVLSGVTKMAWDVMSGVTKTAWDVLSGVANLCGMFCPGMFCPAPCSLIYCCSNSVCMGGGDLCRVLVLSCGSWCPL